MLRRTVTLLLVVLATGAPAAEAFDSFLAQFIADEAFRASRTRAPVRVEGGGVCGVPLSVERWPAKKVLQKLPAPLGAEQLRQAGLSEKISRPAAGTVRLLQFRDEADSYRLAYTFRQLKGDWYFVGFKDSSC